MSKKVSPILEEVAVTTDADPVDNEPVDNTDPVEPTTEPEKPVEPTKEPVEPTKEPEKPVEPTPAGKGGRKTKADLQAQIDLLQSELNNVVDNSAEFNSQLEAKETEITSLKGEVENYKAQVTSLTEALNSIIESKKNALPDNLKALMPEGKNAIETLNWLLKAEGNVQVEKPEIPIGKIIPMENNQSNAQNLSSFDKMTSAFAQLFSKK